MARASTEGPASSGGLDGVAAPYERKARLWLHRLESGLCGAKIGARASLAILAWVASSPRPWAQDWTPHQLAGNRCDVTTIRRALPALRKAGLIEELQPACHEARQAAVYRLTRNLPSFSSARGVGVFLTSQNAESPSPGSTPSGIDLESPTHPIVSVPNAVPGPSAPLPPDPGFPSEQEVPASSPSHSFAAPARVAGGNGASLEEKGLEPHSLAPKAEELARVIASLPGFDASGARHTAERVSKDALPAVLHAMKTQGHALLVKAEAESRACRPSSGKDPNPQGLLSSWMKRRPRQNIIQPAAILNRLKAEREEVLSRIGAISAWSRVTDPLRSNAAAYRAFGEWQNLKAAAPASDSPGFLDHFDAESAALRAFLVLAEVALGSKRRDLEAQLTARLHEAQLIAGSKVWARAWDHHWARAICNAWGLEL